MKNLIWIPNTSLGAIKIGDTINKYKIEIGAFMSCDDTSVPELVRYCIPLSQTYIDVENNKVSSKTSYDSCMYKGKNLIGMNIKELEELIDSRSIEVGDPVLFDDGCVETPVDYIDLGLQAWFADDIVTYVSILNYNT
jgi:hypothetical protein